MPRPQQPQKANRFCEANVAQCSVELRISGRCPDVALRAMNIATSSLLAGVNYCASVTFHSQWTLKRASGIIKLHYKIR